MATTTIAQVIARMRATARIDKQRLVGVHADRALIRYAVYQFRSGGAYGGRPWAHYEAEPRYEAYKRALGASMEPLRWRAGMEQLFPALTSPAHPLRKWGRGPRGWRLEINLPYLARLERGGVNQFGERFPARPILPAAAAAPLVRADVAQAYYAEVAKLWP